ncbi:MAG: DMT family transporter, partial [Bacteroidota bacterium]|nr:DMT family transporter [Bacteroidota bacterium]
MVAPSTPDRAPWQAHLALWGVGLIYAYNYLVAKGLMPEKIGPSGFIALRVAGATPLFWLLYAFRWERVEREDLGRLWLCGLTGVTVNQLLFFNGLAATSPVHASIIMTINPVLVLLISAALLGTAITVRKVLGIALGASGAITLLLNSGGGGLESHASWQGDLMVLLNAASYGVYLVVVKPLMSKYKPITVISWVFLFGGLMAFPVGASQAAAIEWGAFSTQDWLSVGFVVLFTTFVVYLLNIYALG